MQKNNIKRLCLCAILAAFCFVLDYGTTLLNNATGVFKLPLSGLPIIVAALMCGPLMGAAVGLVGTFLTQLITYGLGPTTVLWILPAAVRGLAVGLLFLAFRRSMKVTWLTLEIVISSLLVTAANTLVIYLDSVFYGYYSFATVFGGLVLRIVIGVVSSVVFAIIVPPIVGAIEKQMR